MYHFLHSSRYVRGGVRFARVQCESAGSVVKVVVTDSACGGRAFGVGEFHSFVSCFQGVDDDCTDGEPYCRRRPASLAGAIERAIFVSLKRFVRGSVCGSHLVFRRLQYFANEFSCFFWQADSPACDQSDFRYDAVEASDSVVIECCSWGSCFPKYVVGQYLIQYC